MKKDVCSKKKVALTDINKTTPKRRSNGYGIGEVISLQDYKAKGESMGFP
jgi:hypothetical protein